MTHDEFADRMSDVLQATQLRLSKAARDKQYWAIPQPELVRFYENYRNIDFTTPDSTFQLAVMVFGFVDLAANHRMKELYFTALKTPSSWPAVVEQCQQELETLASTVIEDMDRALGRL